MKALMLHSEDTAVGKYRIWTPAKHLQRAGWDIWRMKDLSRKITLTQWEKVSEGADIIVVQRVDEPEMIALAMALGEMRNCPVVFETDDNIYDVSESSPSYQWWFPGSPLIEVSETFMQNAYALTVSTPELIEVYKQQNPNIFVLPNCQDPEDWVGIERARSSEVVIGWAGSATHYDDLRVVWKPLKRLLRRYPNVKVRIIGCLPDFMEHPQVEMRKDWTDVHGWPKKLAELGFDIGLAPVVQRPFNLAKSNIKWQEYAMLEIPTVASNLGAYKAIRHGETGFLAGSEAAWELHLENLIKDASLRERIGKAAKQQVLAEFNIENEIGQWIATYSQIIASHRTQP